MKRFLGCLFFCAVFLSLTGCSEPEPIKIGFLASTSGKIAQLGQSARDGALLAVEKVNARGGIKGRTVVLEYFDATFAPEKAKEGVSQLHKKGVVAIVGPVASQIAMSMVPVANELQLPIISPTVTTPQLSDKKDYFFRVYPDLKKTAQSLANYAVSQKGLSRFVVIWDSANRAFTEPWKDAFVRTAEELGTSIASVIEFNTKSGQVSHLDIAKEIKLEGVDGFLFLASPMDTAMFCQQLDKLGCKAAIMGSDWSYTGTLTEFGGRTVEGFLFTTGVNMLSTSPTFLQFKEDYSKRFNSQPNFPAVLSYEATMYLVKAISESDSMTDLPARLVAINNVEGLQGLVELNDFGDSRQAVFINEVRGGKIYNLTEIH